MIRNISMKLHNSQLIPFSVIQSLLSKKGKSALSQSMTNLLIHFIELSSDKLIKDALNTWKSKSQWKCNLPVVHAFLKRDKSTGTSALLLH